MLVQFSMDCAVKYTQNVIPASWNVALPMKWHQSNCLSKFSLTAYAIFTQHLMLLHS